LKQKKPIISVVGLGFVGLSLAVANAKYGFYTIGIDNNKNKLKNILSGNPEFFEPNLENYLKDSISKKTILFSSDLREVLKSDITFVTVGTPSRNDGKIDLSNLRNVVTNLSKILRDKRKNHLIVIKSTVVPTTTKNLILPLIQNNSKVGIVVNPEFLREGNAIRDLVKPHLIIIGYENSSDFDTLKNYYRLFYKNPPEILRTSPTTAEMIKYSNNAFLATKVSFINTIANICQNLPSVDVNKVAYAIGKDPRIGPQFLNAGPGFGGSCLPKDLSALIKFTDKFGKTNELLKTVKEVNQLQPSKILDILQNMNLLKSKNKISVLGVAFKKDTDDLREAVSIKIVNGLLKKGLKVSVHDPMAIDNFRKVFGKKIDYHSNVNECLKNSDCCLILTEWDEYRNLKPSLFKKYMKKTNLIDARRILDPVKFSKLNFKAIGLGS
jgi:UDPglucose 6-dehydrogenase